MPVMDGMTTLPELLRIKPEVKVILSSGFDREDAMKGFSGKAIAGFIQKPYSLDKLRLALQNALKPDA
jgi:DNA-binding NtrC family response regulator